jgi:GntR family transcriptional regulator of arabinose operon
MPEDVNAQAASEGPKYKRIYNELREALSDGAYLPGNKLPSEHELVERLAASRPTVRRALAQLEQEGFVERRKGSGTVVAQRSSHKTHVLGLLIPELGSTEIFEPICQGIAQAQTEGHHDLLWGPSFTKGASKEAQAEHLCRYYIDRKVSGVFFAPIEHFAGGEAINRSIAGAFDEAGIPIVLLDRDIVHFPARSRYDLVGIDNHRAGFVLAEHLLQTGSRRVAFMAWPYSAHTVDVRMGGYLEALHVHLGPGAQALVKWTDAGDVSAIQEFLNQAQPDAIICANDYTAAQLLRTLNSIGVEVPAQIRIAGFDDVKYARLLQTPLTTIRQPCLEIGWTAQHAMLNRIVHPSAPSREYLVDFELVIRKSTNPDAAFESASGNVYSGSGAEAGTKHGATAEQGAPLSSPGLGVVRTDQY